MANLTSVGLTAGVPTSGTGTVGTIDNVTGTAGTPSTAVLTVQGVASGTTIPVSGTVAVSGTVPVSIATNTPTIATGTNTIGSVKITDGTNVGTVKAASTAPVTATDTAIVVGLRPDSPGIVSLGQTTKAASVPVAIASDQGGFSSLPGGATQITASATGTTAATTATLAATSGKTTYIAGFTMNAAATAGTAVAATVTGTVTGTLNFVQPVGALTADVGVLTMNFNPPIPASATNTTIACVSGAAGSGGVAAVTAWGYQL